MSQSRPLLPILLGGIVLAGAVLRFWGLAGQILVSDEWHGLHAAATSSYGELARLMTLGATSIPLNLYYKALLDTSGWSEWGIRLPALLGGLTTLVVLPLLVRRLVADRVVVLFAAFLAISPFLIFYSRYARPYSLVVLLTFVATMTSYRWALCGERRHVLAFLASGIAAAYLHVSEARTLLVCIVYWLCLTGLRGRRMRVGDGVAIRPGVWAQVSVAAVAGVALAALLGPAILSSSNRLASIIGRSDPTQVDPLVVLQLFSGSGGSGVGLVFAATAALGLAVLLHSNRMLAGLLLFQIGAGFALIFGSRPIDSDIPIVFARYLISLLPILALAFAIGLDFLVGLLERRGSVRSSGPTRGGSLLAAATLLVFFLAGPLQSLHRSPNNFSNHKAFHSSYAWTKQTQDHFAWFRRIATDTGEPERTTLSEFYRRIAADTASYAVIEYPISVGDVYSPQFDYQQTHRKRVIAGYDKRLPARWKRVPPGIVFPSAPIDFVLGRVGDRALRGLRNVVDISSIAAIRESGARYLILHRDIVAESRGLATSRRYWPHEISRYREAFGEPVFEDSLLLVFEVPEPR